MLSWADSGDLPPSQEAVVQEDQHRVAPSEEWPWWLNREHGVGRFHPLPLDTGLSDEESVVMAHMPGCWHFMCYMNLVPEKEPE